MMKGIAASSPRRHRRIAMAAAVAVGSLLAAACGTAVDTGGASSRLAAACPWDPGFGVDNCYQGDWWLEFSVEDTTTTDITVEVQDSGGTRTIDLSDAVPLGDGYVKFTGGPDDAPVPAGTLIRLTATRSIDGGTQTARTGWFAYETGSPTLDCADASTGDASTAEAASEASTVEASTEADAALEVDAASEAAPDAGAYVDACQPNCNGWQCGDDGCGGSCGTCGAGESCSGGTCVTGCVAPWSPYWQQTEYAGEWWVEYQVAGGGSLPRSVTFQVVGGASYPLDYAYGKWTAGLDGVPSGTQVMLRATDATGATAQTVQFQYLVDKSPATDACAGTPSTSQTCLPLARGMLTITMDDSYESQDLLAKPVLAKYGFKATIYNITQQLDTYGVLPYAQDLAAAGHEVGSHTVTHPDLTTLGAQQLDDELALSQQYLLAHVGSPVESFASPMGSYDSTVIAAIKKYYSSHRTVNPGLNYMGSSVYELDSDGVYDTSTPSSVCDSLKAAATYRGWRILVFHDFTTASVATSDLDYPIADFDTILQCAKATSGLDVVTTRVGANAIRCASP
jgi:peptidoglycan/xylan/chitin deacetylase (PgdA/CDA1 family)